MDLREMKRTLGADVSSLAEELRMFSKAQKGLWQQVPWLALQADGRSGYSDGYAFAYHKGLWRIEASIQHGSYTIAIDCATGEPFNIWQNKPASDLDLLRCVHAWCDFDAERVVAELRKHVKESHFSGYDIKKVEAWRAELVTKLGLKKVFVRKGSVPQIQFSWD